MGAAPAEHALLESARRALRTLARAPLCARTARAALDELEREWSKRPLAIGVGGNDVVGRTAFFDQLCGGGVLNGRPRVPGCAAVRVKRGDATRFRAIRVDGPAEEGHLPPGGVDLEASARVADAEKTVRARERDAETAAAIVPAVLRRKPPAWAVWRWIQRLVVWLRARGRLDERMIPRGQACLDPDPTQGDERSVPKLVRDEEADLEIADDALPAGLEALELNGWSHAAATVDAVVIVLEGLVQAPGGRAGTTLPLGAPREVLARLPALLAFARALRLARRARDQTAVGLGELELVLDRAAVDFAHRVARVEELRVSDRAAFVAAERARMAPQIRSTVSAVLEHADAYLSAELASQTRAWQQAVASATTNDQLKAAVHAVDDGAAALARIAADVHTLVMGGLGGGTRDLYTDLVESLVPHGLPEEHTRTPRAATPVADVELLPSLASASSPRLADTQSWFTGLVRSLEHRRGELTAKVEAYGDRLVQLAHAQMLDAEPRLHAALGDALAAQLETALDHHLAWLDGELARVRAQIDAERAALAPVVQQRADIRRDLEQLTAAIQRVETAQPALSQAASATPAIGSAAT